MFGSEKPNMQVGSCWQTPGGGGGDSVGPRTPTTPPPPCPGASGQQLVAKGAGLRSPWVPKAPAAPRAPH